MSVETSGRIEIIIQMPEETGGDKGDTVGSGVASPANPKNEGGLSSDPVKNEDKNQQVKLATALHAAKSVGNQAVNAAVSNIGLATGNMYMQRQAQAGISAINSAIALAMSAHNPVTFAVTLAGTAINTGSQIYREYKQREIENYTAAQLARRAGFTEDRR